MQTKLIRNWHPATINQLLNVHWSKAAKLKKSDKAIVADAFRNAPKAIGKRVLLATIILKKGQRAADMDAYFKSLLDALVACEMLKDDNRQWLELLPVQFRRDDANWGTEIELFDWDGEVKTLPAKYARNAISDNRVRPTSGQHGAVV